MRKTTSTLAAMEPIGHDVPLARRTSGRTLDHAAPVYDLLAPLMTLGVEQTTNREALEILALAGTEQVLDIGCGTGTLTRQLARRLDPEQSGQAVGVDAAVRMIRIARRKAAAIGNIRFDASLAEELTYPDSRFDRFVSTFFFHHVSATLKRKTLDEIWRVLRPGGYGVIVDVDVPTSWFGAICAWSGYVLFRQPEIRENIRGELRHALEESPFDWKLHGHYGGYISMFLLRKSSATMHHKPTTEEIR